MVSNNFISDFPNELLCLALEHLDPISTLKLMPVNKKLRDCCLNVLGNYRLADLRAGAELRKVILKKQTFKSRLSPRKRASLGKKITAFIDHCSIETASLESFNQQHGVLKIPKEIFESRNLSLVKGKDRFDRRFLCMHVKDKTVANKTSVITLLQRYAKGQEANYWMISQNPSLIHSRKFEPKIRAEDIEVATSIMMGLHPRYQLFSQRKEDGINRALLAL